MAHHHPAPWQQPEQRQYSKDVENRPPAKLGHQEAPGEHADGGAEQIARTHDAVGDAQLVHGTDLRKDFGRTGEGGAFAETEQHAQEQDDDEAAGKAGEQGCERPDGGADEQHPMGAEPFGQPAHGNHAEHIAVIEGRAEDAELGCGEAEVLLQLRSRDGEIAAVDIVDEHRDGDQRDNARLAGRLAIGRCCGHLAPKSGASVKRHARGRKRFAGPKIEGNCLQSPKKSHIDFS
jgi:hypothetical protein